ncbi:MAG TPA: flavodoxin domain-containing protein [Polyangia bacterium]
MKTLILYATRHGQTRKVAEYLGAALRSRAIEADVVDIAAVGGTLALPGYAAAVLAAPVHIGKHKDMVPFVRRHRSALETLPCAFVSVSGSQATAEHPGTPADARARAVAGVQKSLDDFFRQTGWRPAHVLPVAGALLFSKYNFLVRFVVRAIVRRAGAPIDLHVDREYTDWAALDRFADALAVSLRAPPPAERTPPAALGEARGTAP